MESHKEAHKTPKSGPLDRLGLGLGLGLGLRGGWPWADKATTSSTPEPQHSKAAVDFLNGTSYEFRSAPTTSSPASASASASALALPPSNLFDEILCELEQELRIDPIIRTSLQRAARAGEEGERGGLGPAGHEAGGAGAGVKPRGGMATPPPSSSSSSSSFVRGTSDADRGGYDAFDKEG